jgi:hypothetical protein
MSYSLLSPTAITREALRILHAKLVFCKSINRQYDDQFANSGATMSGKIGPSLRIRKPNRYNIRTGANLQLQDNSETYVTLTVSNQMGVDIAFTTADLTMTIDEFGDRYLKPAMSRIAAELDYQAMNTLLPTVYNVADPTSTTGALTAPPSALLTYLNAGAKISDQCAPFGDRVAIISPRAQAKTVDALKSLFQSSSQIAEQYEAGEMGTTAGFKFKMEQGIPGFTAGSRTNTTPTANTSVWVNGATSVTMTSGTTSGTFTVGDTFTVGGVYSVNPETKVTTGQLQQFVVTTAGTNSSGGADVTFQPAVYTTGALQNVTATSYSATAAVLWTGTASTTYVQNCVFHPDWATLATADLILPKGVDFAARDVMDGISMRIVRSYDINTDRLPCRIDILWGVKELYPQWACRVLGDAA